MGQISTVEWQQLHRHGDGHVLLEKNGTFEDVVGGIDISFVPADQTNCFDSGFYGRVKKFPTWPDGCITITPAHFADEIMEILETANELTFDQLHERKRPLSEKELKAIDQAMHIIERNMRKELAAIGKATP